MVGRREPGALEAEILGHLTAAPEPLSPGDLHGVIPGLSYSTITTVLARLVRKGQASRLRVGRKYCYEATGDTPAIVAGRMAADLRRSGDASGVLLRFVSELDDAEAASLQSILARLDVDSRR